MLERHIFEGISSYEARALFMFIEIENCSFQHAKSEKGSVEENAERITVSPRMEERPDGTYSLVVDAPKSIGRKALDDVLQDIRKNGFSRLDPEKRGTLMRRNKLPDLSEFVEIVPYAPSPGCGSRDAEKREPR